MDEPFDLPVTYKGEELLFPAQLKQLGYIHQFEVDVYGTAVFFEPDEEGVYRAIIDSDQLNRQVNVALLKAIAEGIETILR
jgi:hypothetical protein